MSITNDEVDTTIDPTTGQPSGDANTLLNGIIPGGTDPTKFTVTDLLKAVGTYTAGIAAVQPQVQKAVAQQQDLSNQSAAVLSQAGQDASTVDAAKSADDMAQQAALAKTAALLGVSLDAQNNQIAKYAGVAQQAQEEKDAALETIKQKQSVGLFDNPIQYLLNGFTINKDIAQHNAANAQLQSANDRIQQLNQEFESTSAVQKQLAVGTTQAAADASARLASAKFQVEANNQRIAGLQTGIAGIEMASKASSDQLSALYQGNNAVMAEKHLQLAIQNNALQVAAQAEHVREFNLGQARIDAADADDKLLSKSYLDPINLGRQARGLAPLGPADTQQVISALRGKGVLTDTMTNDFSKGSVMQTSGNTQQLISTSPSDLAVMQAKNIPFASTPAQKPVIGVVQNTVGEISSPGTSKDALAFSQQYAAAKAAKDPQAMATIFNARVAQKINAYAANVVPNDSNNPFNIGSFNTIANTVPSVKASALWQKVLAPQANVGVDFSDPNKVFALARDAIISGTLTQAEAVKGYTNLFQAGVGLNLPQRNMQGFGIAPTTRYVTKIDTGATFSKPTIDNTSEQDVTRAFNSSISNKYANPFVAPY